MRNKLFTKNKSSHASIFISLFSAIQGRYSIFEYFLLCTKMEMLRAPWNLQEGYHIPICLYQPMWLCQLWIVTINCYLSWSSVEAFIRWGISVEALIRWSLAVDALSVEANIRWCYTSVDAHIRWCTHPLMYTSVDGHIRWCTHPLMDVIRWSFAESSVDALSLSVEACSLSVDTTSFMQNYKAWYIYIWPSYLHIH